MPIGKIIAEIAGGTLGFIAGGPFEVIPAAIAAGYAYDLTHSTENSSQNMVSGYTPRNPTGRTTGTAPSLVPAKRRRIGSGPNPASRKPKSKQLAAKRKKQSVRRRAATKKIKGVVERILTCKENVGVYTKCYNLDIRPFCNANEKKLVVSAQRGQGNTAPYGVYPCRFTPFSQNRVLDAASILFNGKTPAFDPQAVGNFVARGFKADLLYGSYHMAVTNFVNIPYHFELWEVSPKSSQSTDFLFNAIELKRAMLWAGTEPELNYDVATNQGYMHPELDLGMIKGLKQRYNMDKKKTVVLQPGQVLNYFAKHRECYDFNTKMVTETNPTSAELAPYGKGEVELVLIYRPVLSVSVAVAPTAARTIVNQDSGLSDTSSIFGVEIKEVYKIMQPAETPDAYEGEYRAMFCDIPANENEIRTWRQTGPQYTTLTPIGW